MASFKSTCSVFLTVLLLQFSGIQSHGGADDSDGDASADNHSVNLHSRGLILVKIWCLLILFFSTFAGGVSPYFYRWNETFLLLGTQFAGGVFLGTSLLHFLSDANSTFRELTDKEYPFAFMLAAAGYLLTMLGDVVIGHVTREKESRAVVHSGRAAEEGGKVAARGPAFMKTASFGDTLLLILALCFHSVFEGIAIGVSDTQADAWRALWVISLHKIFAAISMGIALLRMMPKRPFIATAAYSFAFAISSPIGVGIGIALDATTQGTAADWIFAISMGLACGIFIYVAINHLIAEGFRPVLAKSYFDTPLFKFLSVMLGVGIIAVVMIWDV